MTIAARAEKARKTYGKNEDLVHALDDVTVDFEQSKFSAIMGPSGSGKSTLMHCLAGLDTLTEGDVYIGNINLAELNDKQLTKLRRNKVGFIFQGFNLIPTLNAYENVTLPLSLGGQTGEAEWVNQILNMVSLEDRIEHRPSELSGGQQQRVAVARALASKPDIVFADEPTGNLDSKSGSDILKFMRQAVNELGQTIVMVTHDAVAASYADRIVFMRDGKLAGELYEPTPDKVLDYMKSLS